MALWEVALPLEVDTGTLPIVLTTGHTDLTEGSNGRAFDGLVLNSAEAQRPFKYRATVYKRRRLFAAVDWRGVAERQSATFESDHLG